MSSSDHKNDEYMIFSTGFNPMWNEGFEITLCCPELAILRFCVKDFDSTTQNDYVGEYSVPVMSLREGKLSFPFILYYF